MRCAIGAVKIFICLLLALASLPVVAFAQTASAVDLIVAVNGLRASQGLPVYQIDPS